MQVSAQRAWTHLKKYQPLIHELVSRDLKVKYRRSFLGYIWSILNPLLMMLVIKSLLNIKKIKTLNVLLTITFWKMFIVWVLLYFLSI